MSSFRIDRQYVSFETAETEPVFAHPAPIIIEEPSVSPSQELDVSKIYEEIYERLQREHAEQAENMLSKAADEAEEIIEKAKNQAEEYLVSAQAETEKLREEMISTLKAEAEARKAEETARRAENERNVSALIEKLNNDYSGLVDTVQSEIVALVMEITRKVIGIKLSESDDVFMGLVRDALEQLKQAGSVVIRVSSEDYQRYFGGGEPAFEAGDIKIGAIEDPAFTQGDLIVESEGEMIDLSVNKQLNLIEQAFRN